MKKIYKANLLMVKESALNELKEPISEQHMSYRTDFSNIGEVFVTSTLRLNHYRIRNTKRSFKLYDTTVMHSVKSIAKDPIGLQVYNGNYAEEPRDLEQVLEYDDLCSDIDIENYVEEHVEMANELVKKYIKEPIKKEKKGRIRKR